MAIPTPQSKAVSTWSLHRTLGSFVADDPELAMGMTTPRDAAPGLTLLELPAELSARGFATVQICHFHLADRTPSYLAEVAAACTEAGVALDCLLVDQGDLTDPHDADAHQAWIAGWIDDAARLGARRARVIAGKSVPSDDALTASARRLSTLARQHPEIELVTENWFDLLPDAASVESLFDRIEENVGFLIDLGNWTGPGKYAELGQVASRAVTCHAKAHHDGPPDASVIDADDYTQTLTILREADYTGPLALIYDGADLDEWAGLEREHAVVQQVFGSAVD